MENKTKKVWQTPTVNLLAKGYIESGIHNPAYHEVSISTGGGYITAPYANPANHHVTNKAVYTQFCNHS